MESLDRLCEGEVVALGHDYADGAVAPELICGRLADRGSVLSDAFVVLVHAIHIIIQDYACAEGMILHLLPELPMVLLAVESFVYVA